VRETVAGIRSATLADELATSRDVLRAAGVGFVVHGDAEALSPAQALTASWILREATTNVLRHAAASAVSVRIRPGGLVVADDGRGIRGPEGNGVRGCGSAPPCRGRGCRSRPQVRAARAWR
jgi:two-component system sensor histidine kinase DesK